MSRRPPPWASPALALALALAAVAMLNRPALARQVPAGSAGDPRGEPVAAGRSTGRGVTTALAVLAPLTDAGVSGELTALQTGPTKTLVVRLGGLAPGRVQAGRLRSGGGERPMVSPVPPIVGDAEGRGMASVTVSAPLDAADWWVEYHAAEAPLGPVLACGRLRADSAAGLPSDDTERCPIRAATAAAPCP